MDFELKLEKPEWKGAWISTLVMGMAYLVGTLSFCHTVLEPTREMRTNSGHSQLHPHDPYFAMKDVTHALFVSIWITVIALLAFGDVKRRLVVGSQRAAVESAAQTLIYWDVCGWCELWHRKRGKLK